MVRKMLKCPKCGMTFRAPFWDRKKNISAGFTLPNQGVIICPHCKHIDLRKNFNEIQNDEPSHM